MKKITENSISELSDKAKTAVRKRCNRNFHISFEDPISRMLNAIEPDAYFPPHKHENPDKREVFLILRGRVLVAEFEDTGKVQDHCILDLKKGFYGVEIPAGIWHSIISLEKGTVVYEIKDGPYDPEEDKKYAPWAPAENDPKAPAYVKSILEQVGV